MTQEVLLGKETVILDSEQYYRGTEKLNPEEKLVRKAIGLPIKKQLLYYPNKTSADSVMKVEGYKLVEMYDISERWYTIELYLMDGSKVRIHSMYFIEMQKPSFIADMAAQMA